MGKTITNPNIEPMATPGQETISSLKDAIIRRSLSLNFTITDERTEPFVVRHASVTFG